MLFGRVEGTLIEEVVETSVVYRLTVTLETGRLLQVIRDELVSPMDDLGSDITMEWYADQLTQETIGNELASDGWEVIGGGDVPMAEPGSVARSARYAVRRIGAEP